MNKKALLAAAALAAAGCDNKETNPIPPPEPVNTNVALQAFSGNNACSDLEQYLEDTAVLQMRTQLEAARDGVPSWGWWGGGWFGGPMEDAAAPNAAAGGSTTAAPRDYTTTNNQVAGVDEADFVKNDGTRIFALSANKLYLVKSWPAADLSLQGGLQIEGWPQEMFIDGTDKAIVFSTVYRPYAMSQQYGVACDSIDCGYYYSNTVKVTEVDVSNPQNLLVTKETYLPGYYQSARKVGTSVRLVMYNDFNFPQGFRWGPDWQEGLWNDPIRLRAAYNTIIAQNEVLIRQQTLANWVPAALVRQAGVETQVQHPCSDFSRVNAPTRLGQVSVVTLDLSGGTLARSSILAEPGQIYASQDNLYVATQHWWWWPAPGQRDTTYVHKFDITDPAHATYKASGVVDGHILDQFSLDEAAAGELRVVTNINTRVPDITNPSNWWGTVQTTNRLSVLRESQGYLDVVGATADFAETERVMSSRIVGDKGYVVTFRQVDPLFTFDLSDPAHPHKIGEVTIPGFSSYIHPLDANHLLTIGTYLSPTGDWSGSRVQLAIFDVSDLAHPAQTFTQIVGTAYGYSEAQYDHRAFNYFAAKKLLAIPFYDYSYSYSSDTEYWSGFRSALKVYGVDAATGFTEKGSISFSDMFQSENYYGWTYYWEPWVRRSVMADDYVYAVSDVGVRVANVADLATPLKTAQFNRYQP